MQQPLNLGLLVVAVGSAVAIGNALYYDPKTAMLFGDAKSSVAEIAGELKAL